VSFFPLALLLPKASAACRRPQFQRLRLLVAGHRQGLPKTLLDFFGLSLVASLRQQEFPLKPLHFCLVETLSILVH
jgi:hypothetical protein